MSSETSECLPLQYLPDFRIAPPGSLPIYMVFESELETLEHGSPDSKFLTLGVALASAGISFGATLLATPLAAVWLKAIFIACALVGIVNGFLLIYLWRRSRQEVSNIARKIRQRMPADDQGMENFEREMVALEVSCIDEPAETARSF